MLRGNDFRGCTLLVIAHRVRWSTPRGPGHATVFTFLNPVWLQVHTIADADRVLILDDGRVAEFGTPTALLQVRFWPYQVA